MGMGFRFEQNHRNGNEIRPKSGLINGIRNPALQEPLYRNERNSTLHYRQGTGDKRHDNLFTIYYVY